MTRVYIIPPETNIPPSLSSTPTTNLSKKAPKQPKQRITPTVSFNIPKIPLPPRPSTHPISRPSANLAPNLKTNKPSLQNKIGKNIDDKLLGKSSQEQKLLLQLLPEPQKAPPNKISTYSAAYQAKPSFD